MPITAQVPSSASVIDLLLIAALLVVVMTLVIVLAQIQLLRLGRQPRPLRARTVR